jgi:hypothetical protein
LPQHWRESIFLPIYEKGDKTDCSNYKGILLLPTTYKILSTILFSVLTAYINEIIMTISVDYSIASITDKVL